MPNPVPTAALGTMLYGEPATVAVAAAPLLVSVTLVTLSLLSRPVTENSVPAKVTVWPYVLLRLLAVILRPARFTVSAPLLYVIV